MLSLRTSALTASLCAAMALTGCQTSGPVDPSTMSPTEIALRQQETERVRIFQGVATGAAMGAIVGGLAGALIGGGDRDAIIQGALIGGIGGGVAGGADANRVNQETREVASEQQSLREVIASAERNIAYYRRNIDLTNRLIGEEQAKIARNNRSLASGSLTPAAYREDMRNARQNVALVRRQIGNVEEDITDFSRATANVNSAEAAARKRQLETERNNLRRQLARLEETYSRVPSAVALNV